MDYKVLIPQDITDAGKNYLLEKGYEVVLGSNSSIETICKEVVDCDAILARTAPYPRSVMEAGKKLKVIARFGAGFDNVDIDAASELGIYVTNTPIANYNSVAEHTMTFILACAKNIVYLDKQVRAGNWEERNRLKGMELESKVLGLIGLGKIGSSVAKKAHLGLGMKVLAYDPYLPEGIDIEGVELVKDRDYIIKNSDFISLHIPATSETKGSINKEFFKKMKETAYLINCARGEVINEEDLYEALTTGEIKGAALDVFNEEPALKENPLFRLDNIILSPHNGALTVEAMDRMGLHAAMSIDEVIKGKVPKWAVNEIKNSKK